MSDVVDTVQPKFFGARVKRIEDPRFLTGRGPLRGRHRAAQHAARRRSCAARSPTPRSTSIDTSAAPRAARACTPSSPAPTSRDLARPITCNSMYPSWQPTAHPALARSAACGSWARRWRRWSPTTATSPRTPSTWWRSSTSRSRCCTSVEAAIRPGAIRLHDGWEDNFFVKRHVKVRRARPGVRRGVRRARARPDHAPDSRHPARELRLHRGVRRDRRPAHALDRRRRSRTSSARASPTRCRCRRTGSAWSRPTSAAASASRAHLFPEEIACCVLAS